MRRSFLLSSSIFILCACFSANVMASEGLGVDQKAQNRKEIKLLYRQAIRDYKHGRLCESAKAFEKILSLDSSQKKAGYFLENKIPCKFVLLEAKKQERCRLEKSRFAYEEKKRARRIAHAAEHDDGSHAAKRHPSDGARSLFVNENDVVQ